MKYKVGDIVIPVAAASQDENIYPGFPERMRWLVWNEVQMTVVDIKESEIPGDDTIYYVCETPTGRYDRYWWREDWIVLTQAFTTTSGK